MLRQLSNACGVSGDEGEVRRIIREDLRNHVDALYTDTMGNLYAHKRGKGPRVMLAAHMDEVGLRVTGVVAGTGLLSYTTEGVEPRVVVGKRVLVGPNRIPGVIGAKPIHLQEEAEFKRAYKHAELSIDIGARDEAEALALVRPGDPVCFDTQFAFFGDGLMRGKALDDRLGCSVLTELLRRPYDCDLYGVFTVQEEVGCRGALIAANRVQPAVALVLEATAANDMAGVPLGQDVTRVDQGPAITFMDRGVVVKAPMFRALKAAAQEANIPYQLRRGTRGSNDASAIHKQGAGALVGTVSIPCRYIHAPCSVASVKDYENAIRLVHQFLHSKKYEGVIRHV